MQQFLALSQQMIIYQTLHHVVHVVLAVVIVVEVQVQIIQMIYTKTLSPMRCHVCSSSHWAMSYT
jgi:hypothetical protein